MMKTKFFIFIFTGIIFAGGLLLCSSIKTKEIQFEPRQEFSDEIKISKTFKVKPGYKLIVESDIADVSILSHQSDEVDVNFYASGSSKYLKDLKVDFEEGEGTLTIRVKRKREFKFFNFLSEWGVEKAELKILSPQNINAEVKTAGGDAHCEGLKGEISISCAGGDVRLKNHTGSARLSSAGGDIIASDINGELEAKSAGGDIIVRKLFGSIVAKSSGGDVKVELINAMGESEISTAGGDVTVSASSNLNAYVELKATGGDIQIDFPIKLESKTHYELNGWIGNGKTGAKIKISTSGGDIEFKRIDEEI